MRLATPRIEPLAMDAIPEDLARSFGVAPGGTLLNVFRTVAQHAVLAKRWLGFGIHILGTNTLSPRERELLILRTGWLCNSEYEWAQHARIARGCDISDAEILRVTDGPDASGWTAHEAALLRATDELHADSFIADGTWGVLALQYSQQQLLDLIFTVGQYTMVSMFLNSCGVQLEDGMEGWPNGVRRGSTAR